MGAISRSLSLLRKAKSKPSHVVVFRAHQALLLKAYKSTSYWGHFSRSAKGIVSSRQDKISITLINGMPLSESQRLFLADQAHNIKLSKFEIFGQNVPDISSANFSCDWRYGQTWPNQYFKWYNFYQYKQVPYDVKFPWELSRMHYLVPVMLDQVFNHPDITSTQWVTKVLTCWQEQNPLAYSVNWYPMEASMRVLTFVSLLDSVELLSQQELCVEHANQLTNCRNLVLQMLLEHMQFVWANREYTDINGNHFTANIAAIILGTLCLKNHGCDIPKKWFEYGYSHFKKEVLRQFTADGVNFEKAAGYHKLVVELFALSAVALESHDFIVSTEIKDRLLQSAAFSEFITGPCGRAPNFGDNDDATALIFCMHKLRDHRPVVHLLNTWMNKVTEVEMSSDTAISTSLVLGKSSEMVLNNDFRWNHFIDGGYIVSRQDSVGFHLIMDVGEVGMRGRGGHGHNDLLSFELSLAGQKIVVDPGCPCYTADLEKKQAFKKTAVHSTPLLLNQEIADPHGHWGIKNQALPKDVWVKENDYLLVMHAAHDAYSRFAPDTNVSRTIEVLKDGMGITILDEISSSKDIPVSWCFPLCGNAWTQVSYNRMSLLTPTGTIFIESDESLYLKEMLLSDGYGQEHVGVSLHASTRLESFKKTYMFKIYFVGNS